MKVLYLLALGALLCCVLQPAPTVGQLDFLREWFGNLFGLSSDSSSASSNTDEDPPEASISTENSQEIEQQVRSVLWNLDRRLEELLGDLGNFTRSLSDVSSWCYEPTLGGGGNSSSSGSSSAGQKMMNIFDGSAHFRSLAVDYYRAFPYKEINHQRLESLLNSTRQMIEHCSERRQRRQQLQRNDNPVRLGFTVLSDWSLEEMQQLLGFHEPSNQFSSNSGRGKRLTGNDQQCIADRSSGSPPRTHDWRRLGMVTSVKNSLREDKLVNGTGSMMYTTTARPTTSTTSSGRYNGYNNNNNNNNNNGRDSERDRSRNNNDNNYNNNNDNSRNSNNADNSPYASNDNRRNSRNQDQSQQQNQQENQSQDQQQQRGCAADWAFAVTGAIEGAMLVRRRTLRSNASLSLSEQQLLNCAVEDACARGGDAGTALSYVKNYGLSEEAAVPYVGRTGACPYAAIDYFYPIDEYCVRSRFRYSYQSLTEQVDDAEMQRILVQMGPLYVVVDGRPELFRNYRAGVVDESEGCSNGGAVNHAVLLVGYTEDAWLLRDSYGRNWGEDGYFRLARGRNVCGVNSEIAWPLI